MQGAKKICKKSAPPFGLDQGSILAFPVPQPIPPVLHGTRVDGLVGYRNPISCFSTNEKRNRVQLRFEEYLGSSQRLSSSNRPFLQQLPIPDNYPLLFVIPSG